MLFYNLLFLLLIVFGKLDAGFAKVKPHLLIYRGNNNTIHI